MKDNELTINISVCLSVLWFLYIITRIYVCISIYIYSDDDDDYDDDDDDDDVC